MRNMIVEELAVSGAVSLGDCSRRTTSRWVKEINQYLEANSYEWRVKAKQNIIYVTEE